MYEGCKGKSFNLFRSNDSENKPPQYYIRIGAHFDACVEMYFHSIITILCCHNYIIILLCFFRHYIMVDWINTLSAFSLLVIRKGTKLYMCLSHIFFCIITSMIYSPSLRNKLSSIMLVFVYCANNNRDHFGFVWWDNYSTSFDYSRCQSFIYSLVQCS